MQELDASRHENKFISAITIMCCLYNIHQCKCNAGPSIVATLISMIEMKKECNVDLLLEVCTDGKR